MGSKNSLTRIWSGHKEVITLIAVIFMAVGTLSLVSFYVFKHNPDYDSYFLIETGRYIATNHRLPDTAYWLITEDVPTIIQQWLCCIANYTFYSKWGFFGIKILAYLMAAILYGAFYVLARTFTKQKSFAMGIATVSVCICHQFMTTRPYALTITLSILLVVVLKKFFSADKHSVRDTVLFYLAVAGIFIVQANWQISNIVFPMLWICCFIPKLKDGRKPALDLYAMGALAVGAVSTLINPNGIYGTLYLVKTLKDVGIFPIAEMDSPAMKSVSMVCVAAVIILATVLIKDLPLWLIFASAGSVISACIYWRCLWMLMIPLAALVTMIKPKQVAAAIKLIGAAAIIVIGFIKVPDAMVYYYVYPEEIKKDVASYITGDDVVLFTDFNSGNYFTFSGFKVYYDARPDIYGPGIAGDKEINTEMAQVISGDIDYDEFIAKYGFNWFAVDRIDRIDMYLQYNENYENVYDDGVLKIYKAV
jgi:hypothetical protein